MTEIAALWKKLNLRDDMTVAVNDRYGVMEAATAELQVTRAVARVPGGDTNFYLAFATTLAEVEAIARDVAKLPHQDPVVWIAYPKGSSKTYRCEFNRDSGWDSLGAAGFEPVRQVAIDADWSALRFRRVANIKSMTRVFALTDEGRAKVAAGDHSTPTPGA